ncbi:MAG: hypothetical protein M3680_23210, partial [Myxococcota bacterium]|nr:hypothetical protein [Myxococcota bacterium]
MVDSKSSSGSPRHDSEIALPVRPAKPRWAFWKGLLTGVAFEIPTLGTTVWLVARLGVGNPDAGFMSVMRLATLFAGVAALLTAGGIGRLAAYTTFEHGRRRAVLGAMVAHAVASAGLVVIAAIPHGGIDFTRWTWLGLPAAGLLAGALCGAVIGTVCSSSAAVGLADVWSLTRKPSEALRQLLSPGDLVRLGAALRTRTTTLFEGIFDPAPLPPKAPPLYKNQAPPQ